MIRPPRARQVLDTIPAYTPGRSAVGPGVAPAKLSSNELPFPTTSGVVGAVADAAATLNRYPDAAATALVEVLAARHSVVPAQVVPAAGSVAALYHLVQAFCDPGDEVVFAWRSFEAYPIAVAIPGAVAVTVDVDVDDRHDVEAIAAAVNDRTKVVLVCSPNNPTGPVVTAQELAHLLEVIPAGVLVVVDEAYVEFVTDPGAADGFARLADHPNVVVLRTLSKAWGLAGSRVGYLVAHAEVAAAVRKVSIPFGVSSLAQAAAIASLADETTMRERVAAVVEERERVLPAVRALGLRVPVSEANFYWLPVGARSMELAAHLDRSGVIARPFAGSGVRVSLGTSAENDRALEALAAWASPAGH